MTPTIPTLGVGFVYSPGLEPLLEPGECAVDVVEIEPETLFVRYEDGTVGLPEATLARLRRVEGPKLVHSVGFGLAGSRRVPAALKQQIAQVIETLGAAWASGHLAFTCAPLPDGSSFHAGFLLPALQTGSGAATAAGSIRDFADALPVPLAVETGVNYLKPRAGELKDSEFVSRVTGLADCGILLDLHNAWTNECNGRQSVAEFLDGIPLERVWEVHVAGGFEFEGYWLDAHSGAVPQPVLELLEHVLARAPNVGAVIYEIFPAFFDAFGLDRIRGEIEKLRAIWKARPRLARSAAASAPPCGPAPGGPGPAEWERSVAELVTGGAASGPLVEALSADPAVDLYRRLIWRFRAGSITTVTPALTRLMLLHDPQRLERWLDEYFRCAKPLALTLDEAEGFMAFLESRDPDVPFLREVISYERALVRADTGDTTVLVPFSVDPRPLFQALAQDTMPRNLPTGAFELEVTPRRRRAPR